MRISDWSSDVCSSDLTVCGSYAHFKLTRYLLHITRDSRYGDSMERVFYNTVLGAMPMLADGSAFYYSDYKLHTGKKNYYGAKWPCCSGTLPRSEERRVGKECGRTGRSRWSPDY